jgi:hypothetical protein
MGNNAIAVNGVYTQHGDLCLVVTDCHIGNTVNGHTADIAITTHGSDFYFAICAAMAGTHKARFSSSH